jgi:hypothetical protein
LALGVLVACCSAHVYTFGLGLGRALGSWSCSCSCSVFYLCLVCVLPMSCVGGLFIYQCTPHYNSRDKKAKITEKKAQDFKTETRRHKACVVLCCVVLCYLVLSCVVLCCLVLSCLMLYCIVLSCLMLYCVVLCFCCVGLCCLCLVLSCLLFILVWHSQILIESLQSAMAEEATMFFEEIPVQEGGFVLSSPSLEIVLSCLCLCLCRKVVLSCPEIFCLSHCLCLSLQLSCLVFEWFSLILSTAQT